MKNIFTTIRKAMFPTPEERFEAGLKFGREHFAQATTFDALDMLFDDMPLEPGDQFDEGVKAAYRERNTKLGDIDHVRQKIRPPVASEKPAWAQGLDIFDLKIGDQVTLQVTTKRDDAGSTKITDVRQAQGEYIKAREWHKGQGISFVGTDEQGRPKFRGPSGARRI